MIGLSKLQRMVSTQCDLVGAWKDVCFLVAYKVGLVYPRERRVFFLCMEKVGNIDESLGIFLGGCRIIDGRICRFGM